MTSESLFSGDLKLKSKDSLRGCWGVLIGIYLLYILVLTILSIPSTAISFFQELIIQNQDSSGDEIIIIVIVSTLLTSFLSFIILFLQGSLNFGLFFASLKISRDEEVKISDLFLGFKKNNFLRSSVTFVLVNIFTQLWTLLLIIPGIIKGFSYSMTTFIMIDNPNMGYTKAITESRRIMNNHKWNLLSLFASFIPLYLLGVLVTILTCGVGLISFLWIYAYIQISFAHFYNSIKSN